ncbi:hypothetical protein BJ508DRAFT_303140 [Ascobolus immersus RN42]|uniref:CENP-V/GFA domain-containing protein n=1 Tax=Ascobolus immersus RN42 TaxID=1160509 RepID=A0A3N4IU21_ASCIM|nr:hypothetical protein BJ508DRAFT_303140 [Ascobolus immersus RN42]
MSSGEPYTLTCQCGSTKLQLPSNALDHLVDDAGTKTIQRCNCTVCVRQAPTFLLKDPHSIKIISTPAGTDAESDLGHYQRDESGGNFYFCQKCGTRMFTKGWVDVMGGPITSVNAGSVNGVDWSVYKVKYLDGLHDAWIERRDTPFPFGLP